MKHFQKPDKCNKLQMHQLVHCVLPITQTGTKLWSNVGLYYNIILCLFGMCDLFMERIAHLHSKADIPSLELIRKEFAKPSHFLLQPWWLFMYLNVTNFLLKIISVCFVPLYLTWKGFLWWVKLSWFPPKWTSRIAAHFRAIEFEFASVRTLMEH